MVLLNQATNCLLISCKFYLDSELEVYTQFSTLSTEFFFTLTLTSINVGNTLKEERVIISQERLVNNVSTTYT